MEIYVTEWELLLLLLFCLLLLLLCFLLSQLPYKGDAFKWTVLIKLDNLLCLVV